MTLSKRFQVVASVILPLALLTGFPSYAADDLEGGIQEIAKQLSAAMGGGKVKKLAVVEFPDLNGFQSALGQFIAEELITQLSTGANAGQFDVVERRQLVRVLQEQELTDSSLFDAQSISKIGKILGIDTLVTGSIADLGTDIKINARAISVETAKVFAAGSTKISKGDTVAGLMRQNVSSIQGVAAPGSARVPLKPIQRTGVFFQNNFLRIDVTSLTVSKDQMKANLSLMFQNIAQHDSLLAMESQSFKCRATLLDNVGAVVPVGANGYVYVTGLKCVRPDQKYEGGLVDYLKPEFTRFEPGAKVPVILTFEAERDQKPFTGNVFVFSAELLNLLDDNAQRFTVGISDIDLFK